jgi:hypothetical protein
MIRRRPGTLVTVVALSIGLAVGAATAGGAVVVAVLTTSGPFANSPDDPAPPSAAAEKTATATHPSPSPTVDPQPDQLAPDQPFDPARLPPVDTSGWVAYEGPKGTITVRVPPTYRVRASFSTDYTGERVLGDAFKVLSVKNLPSAAVGFAAEPGDLWADLATEPNARAFATEQQVAHQVRYRLMVGGIEAEVIATQFREVAGFEPGVGALTLFVSAPGPDGRHLNGAVHVALPADWTTIATAQAILTEVIWR